MSNHIKINYELTIIKKKGVVNLKSIIIIFILIIKITRTREHFTTMLGKKKFMFPGANLNLENKEEEKEEKNIEIDNKPKPNNEEEKGVSIAEPNKNNLGGKHQLVKGS